MSGTFGYELDLSTLSDTEKEMVKEQVATFKSHYDVIQDGLYYRLTAPTNEAFMAWEMVSEDASEALVSVVNTKVFANGAGRIVKLKGLAADKDYTVTGLEGIFSGEVLMNGGILLPVPHEEYEAVLYHVQEVK